MPVKWGRGAGSGLQGRHRRGAAGGQGQGGAGVGRPRGQVRSSWELAQDPAHRRPEREEENKRVRPGKPRRRGASAGGAP